MKPTIRSAAADVLTSCKFGETALSNLLSSAGAPHGKSRRERRVSNGEDHSDKTFYVINRPNDWGLGSILTVYVRYFDYALRRGWIPVVDMQNSHNLYLDDEEIGKPGFNAWELFFEQPGGYALEDISSAKNIIMASHHLAVKNNFTIDSSTLNSPAKMLHWRQVARKCIRFNDTSENYMAKMRSQTFLKVPEDARILGVYCRGTDYVEVKPKGHAIQPTPEMSIQKAKEAMHDFDIPYLYLVTEDERILSLFMQEFAKPDQLLYIPAQRYGEAPEGETYIWQRQDMLKRQRYTNGIEYLAALQLLSECEAFIGGVTGGTAAMMLLQDTPFSYQFFWELGRY